MDPVEDKEGFFIALFTKTNKVDSPESPELPERECRRKRKQSYPLLWPKMFRAWSLSLHGRQRKLVWRDQIRRRPDSYFHVVVVRFCFCLWSSMEFCKKGMKGTSIVKTETSYYLSIVFSFCIKTKIQRKRVRLISTYQLSFTCHWNFIFVFKHLWILFIRQ